MKNFIEELVDDFANEEFAHAYMEGHRASRIAAQIHALRKDRGWSQAELARRAGIAQERVSKIESADFDSLTMKTLYKFAKAFDIDVRICFDSFSNGIMDVARLNPKCLVVQPREADLVKFHSGLHAGKSMVVKLASQMPQVTTGVGNPPIQVDAGAPRWASIRAVELS